MQLLSALDWLELRLPGLARARRAAAVVRGRRAFLGREVDSQVLVQAGALRVEGRGRLRVGGRCVFVGGPFPTHLRVAPGALLELGPRCAFNYGCQLDVRDSVRLGVGCLLGSYVRVSDAPGRPVRLGDDVWVAHGAAVGPGVTLGDGAVVAAGSVVTCDVPAGMLAMGDPARVFSQGLCST